MNIVFYTHPENPKKVASMVTDMPVDELKERGHIPKSAKTLVDEFDINRQDIDYLIILEKIEYVKFNNKNKPTKLVPDLDTIKSVWLERFRDERQNVLQQLDVLTMRATALQKFDVAKDIEKDKQALRDLPEQVDLSKFKKIHEIEFLYPGELLIDYNAKYKNKLRP